MNWMGWILFLTSAAAVLHAYAWMRFARDTDLPQRGRDAVKWIFVGMTLFIPIAALMRRLHKTPLDSFAFLIIIAWLAGLFFLVSLRMIAGAGLTVWTLGRRLARKTPYDPDRRKFISRALATGTLAAGGPTILYGTYKGYEDPDVREVDVKLDRLPKSASGFTIVQWTDLHVTPWTGEDRVARLVERTNTLKPDAVVITGDLVDSDISQIGSAVAAIEKLKSKYGTFFVTGNHEYYIGAAEWLKALPSLGVRILLNEGLTIADSFYLTGVPDRAAGRLGYGHQPDFGAAFKNRPADLPAILLAHQPRDIFDAERFGTDLQISGHTHGGQIWPFGAIVMSVQPYLSGLHRHGSAQIYVSRGTGTWGVPIRIAAPAELTRIALI